MQSWGNKLFVRKVENGVRVNEQVTDFHPPIWIPAKSKSAKTQFKTLSGYPVERFDAGSIKETKEFIEQNKGVDNFSVYGDIQAPYQYISQNWQSDVAWDISNLVVAYLDIETECENGFPDVASANEVVNAIAIKFSNQNKQIVFGCGEYDLFKLTKQFEYVKCSSEHDLLEKFMKVWRDNMPDIITGWNVKFFDIPYLTNRITKLFGDTKASYLSPWRILKPKEVEIMGRMQSTYEIFGVSVLDYLDLYKKFTYTNQESYKLDHIANVELGVKKIDYSEYGSLHLLYKNDWEKFIDYNAHDITLVQSLEDKLKLIELAITMAYDAKVNFEDVFGQVRMWDVIIYNHLLKKGIVIPSRKDSTKSSIEGAFVKDPIVGFHNWVVSFDLTSLYPMLIQQYNISPECLIEDSYQHLDINKLVNKSLDVSSAKEQNVSIAANGYSFDKSTKGFLPELMAWMFEQRKEYKKKQLAVEKELESKKKDLNAGAIKEYTNQISKYKNLQMAKKIALNSAYGAMGNQYFRFFDSRLAEAITVSGQLSIRWIERKLNEYFNRLLGSDRDYIIAVDTDSVYIDFDPIVTRFIKNKTKEQTIDLIDKICNEQVGPYIDKSYAELAEYMNAYDNKMSMKRESIADRGIWTAKKRYILHVYDTEGVRYAEPKLKIMGIEAVRSSTPGSCRSKIKDALKIIMTKEEDDLIQFVSEFKEQFIKMSPEEIAFPRTVNGLSNYKDKANVYKKATPIHVRGSLLYNHLLNKHDLVNTYSLINEGEKIKFIYLKKPNAINQDIISFSSVLPKEFDLNDSIDFEKQFEKTFLDPLSLILGVIGWNHEKVSTLDSFFV